MSVRFQPYSSSNPLNFSHFHHSQMIYHSRIRKVWRCTSNDDWSISALSTKYQKLHSFSAWFFVNLITQWLGLPQSIWQAEMGIMGFGKSFVIRGIIIIQIRDPNSSNGAFRFPRGWWMRKAYWWVAFKLSILGLMMSVVIMI